MADLRSQFQIAVADSSARKRSQPLGTGVETGFWVTSTATATYTWRPPKLEALKFASTCNRLCFRSSDAETTTCADRNPPHPCAYNEAEVPRRDQLVSGFLRLRLSR